MEMKELRKAIGNFVEKNGKNVSFIGSFVVYGEDGEYQDGVMVAYGSRKCLDLHMEALTEALEHEDPESFVNW